MRGDQRRGTCVRPTSKPPMGNVGRLQLTLPREASHARLMRPLLWSLSRSCTRLNHHSCNSALDLQQPSAGAKACVWLVAGGGLSSLLSDMLSTVESPKT